jgi:FKBP-type peptidyl-prolyl cis-trans isomerase 2
METGDFVQVDYVGRIKDSGEIFDLTNEALAKEQKIFNPKVAYKPVVLILGADFIIKGLDEALRGMKVGEKKKVDIPPEKAFGERKEEMVQVVPEAKFKGQDMEPFPGAVVSLGNNMRGRIISVAGGRVRIDFNHPLAGKTLEYELELKSVIEKKDDKIKAVVEYFTGVTDVEVKIVGQDGEVSIMKDVDIVRPLKSMIAENAIKWCGVERVKFIETFDKQKYESPMPHVHEHSDHHDHGHAHGTPEG